MVKQCLWWLATAFSQLQDISEGISSSEKGLQEWFA
jgi:hypothetical protein